MIKTNRLFVMLVAAMVTILSRTGMATEAGTLLPFQGRLTDSYGNAVSNGAKVIQFKIYDQPSGGTPVWAGEVHRTTVNGGLVNVILGAKTPFTGVDFAQQLYLEITVDIDADNTITVADPPMLPRQVILPVVNSQLLDARDWSAIMTPDNTDPAIGIFKEERIPPGVAVPIGGVIMWWGDVNSIPAGFELCDGNLPSTPDERLRRRKPDLRDRFVKGAPASRSSVTNGFAGGSNNLPPHTHGLGTVAASSTISQTPHTHGVNDPGHSHSHCGFFDACRQFPGWNAKARDRKDSSYDYGVESAFTGITLSNANASLTLLLGGHVGEGAVNGDADDTGANQPAYLELFYIIRVK